MTSLARICLRVLGAAFLVLSLDAEAGAQTMKEPSWPQQFQVLQGESASFGFIVTQAGQITVHVQVASQGAPVVVKLSGPIVQPLQQAGTGSLKLSYVETAADVQKTPYWLVTISAASGAGTAPMGMPQVISTGTISVNHPPASTAVAPPQLQVASTGAKRGVAKSLVNAASLSLANSKQAASQQNAQLQLLMQKMASAQPLKAVPSGASRLQTSQAPPAPAINALSVSQGQPGDPVLIAGASFGTSGELHFVLSPTMDVIAPTNTWKDTEILVRVPDVSGILAYSGKIYVMRAGSPPVKSAAVSFQFNPTLAYADLHPMPRDPDMKIDPTDLNDGNHPPNVLCEAICHDAGWDLFGHKGDDSFYLTKQLKNGWLVYQVNAGDTSSGTADPNGAATLIDSRVGTASPYAKVHWWTNAFHTLDYGVVVIIRGPKGVPYE